MIPARSQTSSPTLATAPALAACVALTALAFLGGCAATTTGRVAAKPVAAETPRQVVLCDTNVERWSGSLPLRIPGGGPVFAGATVYNGSVSLHGKMYWRGDGALLAGQFAGRGVTVDAEVDLTGEAETLILRRVELGDYGILLKYAPVHLVAGAPNSLTVRPIAWTLKDVEPLAPVETVLTCTDTTFDKPPPKNYDPAREMVELGFPGDAPRRWVPAGTAVDLRAEPEGPVRLRLLPAKHGHYVRVVEARDGWSRIVKKHWVGVAWIGWLPSDQLEKHAEGGGGLLGMLAGDQDRPPRRRCAEVLPLSVRVGDEVHIIGEVRPGTLFRVVGEDPTGAARIQLVSGWLNTRDKSAFLLPAKAASCETVPETPTRSGSPSGSPPPPPTR